MSTELPIVSYLRPAHVISCARHDPTPGPCDCGAASQAEPLVRRSDALSAIAPLEALCERLKMEAQGHAQEARTANATIAEIYQCVTGSTGEPGNWNGAKPVREKIDALQSQIKALEADAQRMEDALENIKSWSEAYPLAIFPEPDFAKAHEVLQTAGMTINAISASNMRHVITQVQKIVDAAIRSGTEGSDHAK